MGHIVLLNGIPAAGKSTVAAKLKMLRPHLQTVEGDAVIRATEQVADPAVFVAQALEGVFSAVELKALLGPVVLDQAMPPSFVLRTRTRFSGSFTAVLLTIDEDVRVARQAEREAQGRHLTSAYDSRWEAFGQATDLHDLVLDANGPDRDGLDEDDCAAAILEHVGPAI